jgi:hypothetical protein
MTEPSLLLSLPQRLRSQWFIGSEQVTAPSGTVISENAATMADTLDPNMANNTATVSFKVQ